MSTSDTAGTPATFVTGSPERELSEHESSSSASGVSKSSASELPDDVQHEIALEQAHVDRVYAELEKAGERVRLVETEGLARGRATRSGDLRDEEKAGLFERDALMFSAGKRRATLEQQFEGLVFGRLDLDHAMTQPDADGGFVSHGRGDDLEVRYIGRMGVRDDDYEPLVIDWRAPAAASFYRATPVEPNGVVRRRVLRCRDSKVLGVEDDLMVAEAPDGMTVVGDGALMAALTRSRGAQMRDIVATIQQHQDEAIRADARGVTEITGGPGTGKTVVALHRAAYLIYSDRRRFEAGGILVVGPSAAYTAYIERVLPSLGEDSVILRALGDVVDGITAVRLDSPAAAAIKGSLKIRRVLKKAAADVPPDAPTALRAMVAGLAIHLDENELRSIRASLLRHHQHNKAFADVTEALGMAAWAQVRTHTDLERPEFLDKFEDSSAVEEFIKAWWRPLDAREVLLWLTDAERLARYARGVLTPEQQRTLRESLELTMRLGTWSVADVALIDDLLARLAQVPEQEREERGFYEIEEFDNLSDYGVNEVEITGSRRQVGEVQYEITPTDARERLLAGRLTRAQGYSHVLVDEAQDLSPMQWRALGRRGRTASWTVVGDLAQASWPDLNEARDAREEAFGAKARQSFHMTTNYRNAREIFDFAAEFIRRYVPDADIPQAVRETGVHPTSVSCEGDEASVRNRVRVETQQLLDQVDGSVAVIAPALWRDMLSDVSLMSPRVVLIDPMSTKGLEYDATLVVDPDEITAESPGGARVLYVVLTRAAHRMTVLEVATSGETA